MKEIQAKHGALGSVRGTNTGQNIHSAPWKKDRCRPKTEPIYFGGRRSNPCTSAARGLLLLDELARIYHISVLPDFKVYMGTAGTAGGAK